MKEVLVRGRSLYASSSLLVAECTLIDSDVMKIDVVITIENAHTAWLATDRNVPPAQAIDDLAPIVEVHGAVKVHISKHLACGSEQIAVAIVATRRTGPARFAAAPPTIGGSKILTCAIGKTTGLRLGTVVRRTCLVQRETGAALGNAGALRQILARAVREAARPTQRLRIHFCT